MKIRLGDSKLLNEALTSQLIEFDGQRPYLMVTTVSPARIQSYLNKSETIKASLGRSYTPKIEAILNYLHDAMSVNIDNDIHIFSINDIAININVSVSSVRRTLEACEKIGVLTKHAINMKSFNFNTWELSFPKIHQEVEGELMPQKPLPIRIKSDQEGDKQLLSWAENMDQQDTNIVLLYGKTIFKILQKLFLKKSDRKSELQSVEAQVIFNNQRIPAIISCNVKSELPYSDDLIKYFAILECVEQSMKENCMRDPLSVLKKITYEVPINKIIEQLGIAANATNRNEVVKSIRRLEAKIELPELPETEYLSGKDSFISFQPLANVSVLRVKKLDRKKVTGNGVMIATFTLPEFIVNSLIQRVGAIKREELEHIQHTGLIEDLLELPSAWVKGRYDLLAETLLTVKATQTQDDDGRYFTSWANLHIDIETSRSPGTLRLAVCRLAMKKGAKESNGKVPKIILTYKDVVAVFDNEGVTISLNSN